MFGAVCVAKMLHKPGLDKGQDAFVQVGQQFQQA